MSISRVAPFTLAAAAFAIVACGSQALSSPDAGAGAQVYVGSVAAYWSNPGGGLLSAGFPDFGFSPVPSPATTSCDCGNGIALPGSSASAGTITVLAGTTRGPVLASLVYRSDGACNIYGQADASWTPGDTLAVAAPGDAAQVHAFSGGLQTGLPLAGLSSPFGSAAQTPAIPITQPFVVSWTPEGRPGEAVVLILNQTTPTSATTCGCTAPDSAGTLTVPAALLLQNFVSSTSPQTYGTLDIERIIDTPVSSDNALVHLLSFVDAHATAILQ